jgi:vacuolar-type H+-ATPase subunit F/Vma7
MGTVAVIGEPGQVTGYLLAGATVLAAADADASRQAWASLDPGVALVIVTAAAGRHLADELESSTRLTVVMPV